MDAGRYGYIAFGYQMKFASEFQSRLAHPTNQQITPLSLKFPSNKGDLHYPALLFFRRGKSSCINAWWNAHHFTRGNPVFLNDRLFCPLRPCYDKPRLAENIPSETIL